MGWGACFLLVVLLHRFSNPAPENLREANLTPLPPWTEGQAPSPQLAEPQTQGCWLPSIEASGLGEARSWCLSLRPSPHPRPLTLGTPPPAPHSTSPGRSLCPEPQVGGQACNQWPRSSLAWGPRAVHRWEKVPRALGPVPPTKGHQGGRWRRRKRKGRRINAGAKRGAGPAETRSPLHTRSTSPSTHTHTHTCTHSGIRVHMDTLSNTPTHTLSFTCAHPRMPIHRQGHTHLYTCVMLTPSVWIHVEAPTCSHIHTHSHTRGHNTHMCIGTCTAH